MVIIRGTATALSLALVIGLPHLTQQTEVYQLERGDRFMWQDRDNVYVKH
jgi:hypothetical protein